jgi:hypothetical protein
MLSGRLTRHELLELRVEDTRLGRALGASLSLRLCA